MDCFLRLLSVSTIESFSSCLFILNASHILPSIHKMMLIIKSRLTSTYCDRMILYIVNINDTEIIIIIAARWQIPAARSLWCIWLLSGIKGCFFIRMRLIKTRITSKHGIIKGANANTAGLNEAAISKGWFNIFILRIHKMIPIVKLPVSPMNIFFPWLTLPKTL